MDHPPEAGRALARVHTAASLAILAVAGGLCATLLALAHSPGFEAWMRAIRWEEAKRANLMFLPVGHISDDADRVLNEEIPATDFRRGGVVIMGTSNTTWGLKTWDLPEEQRALIHNVALPMTGHTGQGLVLRYLVDREGLLDAGPGKTLVVFGAGYQNVGYIEHDGSNMSYAMEYRGFYKRGPGRSIERSGLGTLARVASIEKARVHGVAKGIRQMVACVIRDGLGFPRSRVLQPDVYVQGRISLMGPDWRERIDKELAELMRSIDYLKAKGAEILLIQMPQGSWEDRIPFDRTYNEELLRLCRGRGLKIIDLRRLVDDQDYVDSTHLTPTGMEKFERAVLPIWQDHLRSAGLLPEKGL